MADGEYQLPLVIDNGSYLMKSGFGEDDNPRSIFPTLIGKPKNSIFTTEKDKLKETFIGYDTQLKRNLLSIINPIQKGIITNFEEIEKIWKHIFFNELRTDPESDYDRILMTETSFNPKQNREKNNGNYV